MRIQKIQDNKQKVITTSLIVSTEFCENIIPLFQDNKEILYKTFDKFSTTVINWCMDYYQKYNKAPQKHIQDIFNDKKQYLQEDERSLIKQLLKSLSENYERSENFNEPYVIDQAKLYIREFALRDRNKKIDELLKSGQIEEAEHLALTFDKLDKATEKRQSTDIFYDMDMAREVCTFDLNKNKKDQLFKFPGELGKRLEHVYREDFFLLAGATKKGKSFYLREIALEAAINNGLNVIVLNLEMSHTKYLRNFYQNITGETKKPLDEKIKIPTFEKINGDKYGIEYIHIDKKGLSFESFYNKSKKIKMKTKGKIIVETYPTNTFTYQRCVKILDDFLLQGFVCDLLLIDYLDNWASHSNGDFRHTLDEKWLNGRRIGQEKHIAVGTVKHTNTSTFKGNVKPGTLAEDNRALWHVTHGIGINQSPKEKRNQYSRLNIIANRDENFDEDQFFISLECRDIGKVMIDTMDSRNIDLDLLEEEEDE